MAGETILVIDADQDLDERITSALEAEGYLVFAGSSQVITDELAEKLKPSLIYIKPLAASAAGFEPCKMIHAIPRLKNVPIIILASIKGSLDPRYTTYYGIVDFLPLTFTPEDLTKKTDMFLELMRPFAYQAGPAPDAEESLPEVEEPAAPQASVQVPEEPPAPPRETVAAPEPAPKPVKAEPRHIPEPEPKPARPAPAARTAHFEDDDLDDLPVMSHPPRRPAVGRTISASSGRGKRSSLLPVLIVLLVLAIIGGGGFLSYLYVPQVRNTFQRLTGSAPAPSQPVVQTEQPAPEAPPVPAVPAPPIEQPAPQPAQAPAEQPAPAAAPVKPAVAKQSYSVQVGAFKTKDIAADLVKRLKAKGYEAYAQEGVTADKSPIIRVLVGAFPDRKDAVKLATEIQSKEQLKTTIFIGK